MPRANTDCPLCWGLGCAIRTNRLGRMFEWPCPYDCAPGLVCIAVNNRQI
jgi:hypothetical protein